MVSNLSYSFKERILWSDLNFSMNSGDSIFITGPSGSGKTTLLQCLGALEKPSSGSILFGNLRIDKLKKKERRSFLKNSVSFVFQNSGLVPSWSVKKNIELGNHQRTKNSDAVEDNLRYFCLDPQLLNQPAYTLSGGEQQRVALVRASLRQTPLLILDEPTAALDDTNAMIVSNFIDTHTALGGIAIIATHDPRLLNESRKNIHMTGK